MAFVWRWQTVFREYRAEQLLLSWDFMISLSVRSTIWYLAR